MTLNDVLKEYNNKDFTVIECRTIISIDSDDVEVTRFCSYRNHELINLDEDCIYSLDNTVTKYEIYKDDWIIVWIESEG